MFSFPLSSLSFFPTHVGIYVGGGDVSLSSLRREDVTALSRDRILGTSNIVAPLRRGITVWRRSQTPHKGLLFLPPLLTVVSARTTLCGVVVSQYGVYEKATLVISPSLTARSLGLSRSGCLAADQEAGFGHQERRKALQRQVGTLHVPTAPLACLLFGATNRRVAINTNKYLRSTFAYWCLS